ncbi:HEPN domain-containing protein [Mesorhizobium neociceri]|uniref:Apea-like HEPN domain-containing protein n=1 Tax=Mesorhizobium neociceri TaxID=1307853 RepID=A0A838BCH1_9HYPH|nr:HEPN domain-containing protein [Mesorhizobium neociceri]MBA1143739.1 hypothetical protein [Mesorhizobium neociceri]
MEKLITDLLADAFKRLGEIGVPVAWSIGDIDVMPGINQKSYTQISTPNLQRVLYKTEEFPPFVAFANALRQQEAYAALFAETPADNEKALLDPIYIAHEVLRSHMEAHPLRAISPELTTQISANLADCINRKVFMVRGWSPLAGFNSTQPEIDCGNGMIIRRYSEVDAYRIGKVFEDGGPFDMFNIWPYALEWNKEHSFVGEKPDTGSWQNKIYPTVRALRVLAPGKVAIPFTKIIRAGPGRLSSHGGGSSPWSTPFISETNYNLAEADYSALRDLIEEVARTDLPNPVRIALDRVYTAVERSGLEDEFIDHIVALEAMYGDNLGGLPGGLSHKIGVRLAMFLYSTAAQRHTAFRQMLAALSARGGIVHGSMTIANLKPKPRAAVEWAGDAARASVRKALLEDVKFEKDYFEHLIFSAKIPAPRTKKAAKPKVAA